MKLERLGLEKGGKLVLYEEMVLANLWLGCTSFICPVPCYCVRVSEGPEKGGRRDKGYSKSALSSDLVPPRFPPDPDAVITP